MNHMKTTTPPKSIRLTIPVSPEVHETFTRIAEATGTPVGRAMGEWLGDTLDAAQHVAQLVSEARAAPRKVAQQLHAYAHGLTDETGQLLDRIRKDPSTRAGRPGTRSGPAGAAAVPGSPPSCNTGGKVPKKPAQRVEREPGIPPEVWRESMEWAREKGIESARKRSS